MLELHLLADIHMCADNVLGGSQHQFHERIAQLVYTFPEDAVTSTGSLFWSAPKRFPHALDFDPKDPAHAHFAQAGAILRAEVYGIPRPAWAMDAAKVSPLAHLHRTERMMVS